MKTTIRLPDDKVLLKRTDAEAKTKPGICLPDKAREKPGEATIVAAGSGRLMDDGERAAPRVKKDDKVLTGKRSGTELTIEDDEMLVMSDGDILRVVK